MTVHTSIPSHRYDSDVNVLKIQNQTWWHLLNDGDVLYSQNFLPREPISPLALIGDIFICNFFCLVSVLMIT